MDEELRHDLAAISQQQRVILTAIQAMQAPDVTVLRADVNAGTAKLEKELAEQKKSYLTSVTLWPSSQLELIGWKRDSAGVVQRYYREIGQRHL